MHQSSPNIGAAAAQYQALGGTWNNSTHVFTASSVQPGTAGTPVTIDLDNEQRVLISDNATGWSLGASFLASTTSKPLTLTATTISGSTLTSLQGLLGARIPSSVVGSSPSPAVTPRAIRLTFLSTSARADPRDGLEVWHYDGSNWTEFVTNDLTYDGTFASFTVTGFSGYAVTTVPEPGTLALLMAAGFVLFIYVGRPKREMV